MSHAVKTHAENIYVKVHVFTLAAIRHKSFLHILRRIFLTRLTHVYLESNQHSQIVSPRSFQQDQRSFSTFLRKYTLRGAVIDQRRLAESCAVSRSHHMLNQRRALHLCTGETEAIVLHSKWSDS